MRRMGWFLLLLFFFPSSSNPLQNPFQHPLQNSLLSVFGEDQNARNSSSAVGNGLNERRFGEEIIRDRRLKGHAGGHGGRGYSGGVYGGGGGVYGGGGGGVMSHHNNDKDNRHIRGANSCTTNHIGFLHVAFLISPFLFLM